MVIPPDMVTVRWCRVQPGIATNLFRAMMKGVAVAVSSAIKLFTHYIK